MLIPHVAGGDQRVLGDGGIVGIQFPTCSSDINPIEHLLDVLYSPSSPTTRSPRRTSIISSGRRPDGTRSLTLLSNVTWVSGKRPLRGPTRGSEKPCCRGVWGGTCSAPPHRCQISLTVKTEPADLICCAVSAGLLLMSFHSACN